MIDMEGIAKTLLTFSLHSRRTGCAFVTSILMLATALSLSSCLLPLAAFTEAPIRNTPEEYEQVMEFYENEELLGLTKDEIQNMMGFPNSWGGSEWSGLGHGGSCWDDDKHVWSFASKKEKISLNVRIYFSDEGLSEQVIFRWKNDETDKHWSDDQGIISGYYDSRYK